MNEFIRPITICRQWTTKFSKNLLSLVSGKVLTHQTKLITNYGHKLSKTEVADLQELVKVQNDFKIALCSNGTITAN
jgi:hypothetical protein